jgi:NAD(P)-dependent dehydrogenase (short-subunit alcohol dehydrogenase family)
MAEPLAIVVAAGPGVGSAVARRFARDGFRLAVLSRRQEAMDALAADLGGGARGFSADAADPASLEAALAEVLAAMGPPKLLVYNASLWREAPGLSVTPEVLEADFRLCVTGALVASKAVQPTMTAAGGGTIIWTGGGLALAPQYGAPVPGLTAGKSAMRGLVFAMADAFRDVGIHLCTVTIAGTVAPGTAFDPDRIAEAFVAIAAEPREAWEVEHIFRGA